MDLTLLNNLTGNLDPLTIGALTVGITQVIKNWLPDDAHGRWCPIIAIAIALILVFLGQGISQTSVIQGLATGLTATGLYGAAKDVSGGKQYTIRE